MDFPDAIIAYSYIFSGPGNPHHMLEDIASADMIVWNSHKPVPENA